MIAAISGSDALVALEVVVVIGMFIAAAWLAFHERIVPAAVVALIAIFAAIVLFGA